MTTTFPEAIDLVVYINLNSRVDRKQEMEAELKRMGVPPEKILRWEGTRLPKNGALGCSMSHVAVLEYLQKLPETVQTILVLEDDFNFSQDRDLVIRSLRSFLNHPRDLWDLALLSYIIFLREDYDDVVSRCLKGYHTSGYLVNRQGLGRILANFKEGCDNFAQTGSREFVLDRHWWILMKDRRCFYFNKSLGYQRKSYSNVDGSVCERQSVLSLE